MDQKYLCYLNLFRQNSNSKVGGQTPPEIKVGGPRAMHPPGSATYGINFQCGGSKYNVGVVALKSYI